MNDDVGVCEPLRVCDPLRVKLGVEGALGDEVKLTGEGVRENDGDIEPLAVELTLDVDDTDDVGESVGVVECEGGIRAPEPDPPPPP